MKLNCMGSRALTSGLLLSMGALSLAGCGGGGGGGGSKGGGPAPSGTLLYNDFSSSASFSSNFSLYDASRPPLQRTRWGNAPQFKTENGVTFARLQLDTYNAAAPGQSFKGTEFFSKQQFSRGQGVAFEARVRMVQPVSQSAPDGPVMPTAQRGMIGAFFTFNERYANPAAPRFPDEYYRSEIDFEYLTNDNPPETSAPRSKIWTNIYNDYQQSGNTQDNPPTYFPGSGYNNGINNQDNEPTNRTVAGLDYGVFNLYRIEWKAGQTKWFVNGKLIRTEDINDSLSPGKVVDPDEAMQVHFDLWSGSTNPPEPSAFRPDPSLFPVSTKAENRVFYMDVDYVKVMPLGTGATAQTAPIVKAARNARTVGSSK